MGVGLGVEVEVVQTAFSSFYERCFLPVLLFRSLHWFWGMVVRGFARRDLC